MALWSTKEVAEEFGRSEDWVREHAAELGGIRLGRTSRSPLGFEPEDIAAYKRRQRLELAAAAPEKSQRAGRRPVPAGVELLPLPAAH